VALIRASSPSRPTNVATSSSPAFATRLGSSKVTSMRSIPRDTAVTGSASSDWVLATSNIASFPSREALSADARLSTPTVHRWIEA